MTAVVNNIEYYLDFPFNGYCGVKGSAGAIGSITIPATITVNSKSYFVYSLYYRCFYQDTQITAVTIENGVREINTQSFLESNITSIIIPPSVSFLDNTIFKDCRHLTNVVWQSTYSKIGSSNFEGCTSLTSISLPDTIVSIDPFAFKGCTSLTTITLPFGVTAILDEVFRDCTSLVTVNLPSNLLDIYRYAFAGCTSLATIQLPRSLRYLRDFAFADSGLTSVSLPDVLATEAGFFSYIGTNVFDSCRSLTSMTWSPLAKGIPDNTFKNCENLANLTIFDGTTISSSAFDGCVKLKLNTSAPYRGTLNTNAAPGSSLYNYFFPAGSNGFYLNYVFFDAGTYRDTVGDVVYFYDTRTSKAFASAWAGTSNNVTVKSRINVSSSTYTVDSIAGEAFINGFFTSVTVENGISFIGQGAFSQCTFLSSVSLPNTLTSLLPGTFQFNTSLLNIDFIPLSVTYIGDYCFYRSGITNAIMKNSVNLIGFQLFNSCINLLTATISNLIKNVPLTTFGDCTNLVEVTIPDSVYYLFFSFYNCSSLTTININPTTSNLVSIDSSFQNCTSLTSFVIPKNIVFFASDTFQGCTSLASISLPQNLGEFKQGNFSGLTTLQTIEIPPLITDLPSGLFDSCSSLNNIVIPDTVSTIGSSAFFGCTSLEQINIPPLVTNLSDYVFYGCTALSTIEIPSNVQTIGESTFYGCTSLTSVNFT